MALIAEDLPVMADISDCADQLKELNDSSRISEERLDEVNENVLISDTELYLGPITHDYIGENRDPNCSPITLFKRPQPLVLFGHNVNCNKIDGPLVCNGSSSPRTPKDVVFDPFAPSPDDKVLSLECIKFVDELRKTVAHSLWFDFSLTVKEDGNRIQGDEYLSDDMVLELVYANILEAIVSTHPGFAHLGKIDLDSESYMTPMMLPRLNGVAETCPPLNHMVKSMNIDAGLCRKLEF